MAASSNFSIIIQRDPYNPKCAHSTIFSKYHNLYMYHNQDIQKVFFEVEIGLEVCKNSSWLKKCIKISNSCLQQPIAMFGLVE